MKTIEITITPEDVDYSVSAVQDYYRSCGCPLSKVITKVLGKQSYVHQSWFSFKPLRNNQIAGDLRPAFTFSTYQRVRDEKEEFKTTLYLYETKQERI